MDRSGSGEHSPVPIMPGRLSSERWMSRMVRWV